VRPSRGILQRSEDRFAVTDLQRDDPHLAVVGALEPFRRVDQFGFAEPTGELQDEPSRARDAGEIDAGRRAVLGDALLRSSKTLTGSAVRCDDPTREPAA